MSYVPPAHPVPVRKSRLGWIIGGVIGVLLLTIAGVGVWAMRNFDPQVLIEVCPAPKQMLQITADKLEPDFTLHRVRAYCSGELPTEIKGSGVSAILLPRNETYNSNAELGADVTRRLESAGWTETETGEFSASVKGVNFKATLEASSYRPAMARLMIAEIRDGRGNLHSKMYPEGAREPFDEMKYSTTPTYTSTFIPAGYTKWGEALAQLDTKSMSMTLLGGTDLEPQIDVGPLGGRNPGQGCFSASGDLDPVARCTKIGRVDGSPVMRYELLPNEVQVVRGKFLIRLLYVYDHPNVKPAISHDDVLAIVRGLKQVGTPALSD